MSAKVTVVVTDANYKFLQSRRDESYSDTINRVLESYRDFGPLHERLRKQIDRLEQTATTKGA